MDNPTNREVDNTRDGEVEVSNNEKASLPLQQQTEFQAEASEGNLAEKQENKKVAEEQCTLETAEESLEEAMQSESKAIEKESNVGNLQRAEKSIVEKDLLENMDVDLEPKAASPLEQTEDKLESESKEIEIESNDGDLKNDEDVLIQKDLQENMGMDLKPKENTLVQSDKSAEKKIQAEVRDSEAESNDGTFKTDKDSNIERIQQKVNLESKEVTLEQAGKGMESGLQSANNGVEQELKDVTMNKVDEIVGKDLQETMDIDLGSKEESLELQDAVTENKEQSENKKKVESIDVKQPEEVILEQESMEVDLEPQPLQQTEEGSEQKQQSENITTEIESNDGSQKELQEMDSKCKETSLAQTEESADEKKVQPEEVKETEEESNDGNLKNSAEFRSPEKVQQVNMNTEMESEANLEKAEKDTTSMVNPENSELEVNKKNVEQTTEPTTAEELSENAKNQGTKEIIKQAKEYNTEDDLSEKSSIVLTSIEGATENIEQTEEDQPVNSQVLTKKIVANQAQCITKEVQMKDEGEAVKEVVKAVTDDGNKDEPKIKAPNSDIKATAITEKPNDTKVLPTKVKHPHLDETNESQESTNLVIDEQDKMEISSDEDVVQTAAVSVSKSKENRKLDQNSTIIEIDDDDDIDPNEAGQKTEDKRTTTATTTPADVVTVEKEPPALLDDDVEMKIASDQKDNVTAATTDVTREIAPVPLANITSEELNSDDTSGEIFYSKECINLECARDHKQFMHVPNFALSYFRVNKKKYKSQFICVTCYDKALDTYEEFCGVLMAKQPLLMHDIVAGRQEFVEIIDSSDDEDECSKTEKENESPCFSKADLSLIADELENTIKEVYDKVEIQNQLTWSKTLLTARVKRIVAESDSLEAELLALQKKADKMHVSLYQCPKIKTRQMLSLDLNSGMPYQSLHKDIAALPAIGEVQRPPVQINSTYYAVKNKAIASWVPCKVTEAVDVVGMGTQKSSSHYKVKFLKSQYQMLKTVSVKHLAYYDAPSVRLPIGARVIAYFDATLLSRGKERMMIQSAFYPGIIAEPLKVTNKFRYLVFYDDGYTQYVHHKDVRLVCHAAENVWEDVHPGSRDFIQKYLTQYSINRPMVQTQKGQSMTTESNGKWIYARVVDIDCSLIQMQFEGPKSHTEWIYRGSLRLGPVFKEYQKTQKDELPISRLPRRTEPFIRYTEDEEAATISKQQRTNELKEQAADTRAAETRAVAKKSVSRPDTATTQSAYTAPPPIRQLNYNTIYLDDGSKPKGKVVYYTAKRNLLPRQFKEHDCSKSCLFEVHHNLNAYSPLSKPLLSGWERMIIRQKVKKCIAYRGPCGRILRNMKDLHYYLRCTQNVLNVENFDFTTETNCLAEYVIESTIVQRRDISCGQEKMAIPMVNYYDNSVPPACTYAAQRIPTEGVHLNLSEEFLVGCDCEDDCSDKTKCACWQLTYAGAKYGNPNTPVDEIGYQYKRLYEHVPTGIYECNSRCKCKSNCLNRVVQHSLEMKLQVFKTSNRGWGLRCINDVPRGSFICIYAGHLLTEAKANEGGLDAGDEYFAELDYIEVAEQIKEGYESEADTMEPDEEDDPCAQEMEDDDDFRPSKSFLTRSKRQQRQSRGNHDDDSQERQVINFNPNADMNENSMRESSIRKLFGIDEACYVMDAKTMGNLGRYFNHSCSPNLFVQNVFVDTHDLRFPWVAFFSSTHIRAGTELTWNYNYEVGVVPGKVLYCQCGAANCRLRLL